MSPNHPLASEDASEDAGALLARRLARILQITLVTGIAVVVVGSALEIARHGHLGRTTAPLAELASGVVRLQGGAILTCGLIVLLIAPATGLAYLVAGMLAARDRLHALVAAVVLAILIASMLVKGVL